MPRGGRRPGAGAPKGNLNAFRTGKHSKQYKRLLEILSRDPEAVRLLEEIALGDEKRIKRRRRYAMQVLGRVLQRSELNALDRAVDEWERSRALPASILDIAGQGGPGGLMGHKKKLSLSADQSQADKKFQDQSKNGHD